MRDEATVGERVAFYRRRRGITQEVLAGLLLSLIHISEPTRPY